MRSLVLLTLVAGLVTACTTEQSGVEQSPEAAALRFLSHIDSDNYEQSWTEAAAL